MDPFEDCVPGRRATVTHTVADADTAQAMGSGDVPVLGTPKVLALAEKAAVQALGGCTPEDQTTVGSWVEIEHRVPVHLGQTVEAKAVLLGVHGRRLEFSISLTVGDNEVAHLRHRRVLVRRSDFVGPG